MKTPTRLDDADEEIARMAAQYDNNTERIAVLEERDRNAREKLDDLRKTLESELEELRKQQADTGAKVQQMFDLLMQAQGAKRVIQLALFLFAGVTGAMAGKIAASLSAIFGVK